MESKPTHEVYLIVIACVLAAVIIGYNTLLAPKVNGIGVVYTNYDVSSQTSPSSPPVSSSSEESAAAESSSFAPPQSTPRPTPSPWRPARLKNHGRGLGAKRRTEIEKRGGRERTRRILFVLSSNRIS